jgi:DNA-binding MarR family transcriptional regulator
MAIEPGAAAHAVRPAATPTERASVPALNLVLAIHRLRRGLRAGLPPGQFNFNPTQLLILTQLAGSDPMRVGELAQRVHCSQPTATTVVNGLEAVGLVSRIKDSQDGRAIKVSLTEAGANSLREVGQQEAAYLETLMNELPEQDRATMIAAVPVLLRIAEASMKAENANPISGNAARAGTWGTNKTSGS